jgi:tRNA pseudouridine55 synthase
VINKNVKKIKMSQKQNISSKNTPSLQMDKRLSGLHGVFGVLKPAGESSAKTVDRVKKSLIRAALNSPTSTNSNNPSNENTQHFKRLSRQIKVGHGGTLDPMATGVLVIGLNGGCRELAKYLSGPKAYCAHARFGEHFDSLDSTGKLLQRDENWWKAVGGSNLQAICEEKFVGETVMQIPPAFSAIHVNGKRAYELARNESKMEDLKNTKVEEVNANTRNANDDNNVVNAIINTVNIDKDKDSANNIVNGTISTVNTVNTVNTDNIDNFTVASNKESINAQTLVPKEETTSFQLAARPVAIYSLSIEASQESPDFSLNVSCGGGCYIRSLIRDIAAQIGTLAHMTALERTKQGIFTPEMCLKSEDEWGNLDLVEEAIKKAKSLL